MQGLRQSANATGMRDRKQVLDARKSKCGGKIPVASVMRRNASSPDACGALSSRATIKKITMKIMTGKD